MQQASAGQLAKPLEQLLIAGMRGLKCADPIGYYSPEFLTSITALHRITPAKGVPMPNPATSVSNEIARLRRSLRGVDSSLQRLAPKLRAAGNGRDNGKVRPASKRKLSPKRRAQLKLQGQYIGYMRLLKPRQKAEVKRVRERKGMQVAIRKAKKLVS